MKTLIAGMAIAASALAAQPAAAYRLTTTGYTEASPRLVNDVLDRIASYSKANGGCNFLFSADMRIMPNGYRPAQPTVDAAARGGHFERWTVNACAAKQVFQIAMWPSVQGGADFAVTPLTGRLPLHVR